MRVAVDANILIAGTVWPRWPYEVLRHAERGNFTLVLSPIVIREAHRHIRNRFPQFAAEFEEFLSLLDFEEAPTPSREEVEANQDLVRQIEDIPVALSVAAANVDYFVTYDRDFTDANETTEAVQQLIPGIMLAPIFLRDVMGWDSDELEAIRRRNWTDLSAAAA